MKPGARRILAIAALMCAAPGVLSAAERTAAERLTAIHSKTYGAHVANADGRAIYLFTADRPGKKGGVIQSTCYGACAQAWPPVPASEHPAAGAKLNTDLLGTIRRKDGSLQLTYGGWPLYYYSGDRGAGSVAGQDMHGFGGGWYLIAPDGSAIKKQK